MRIRWIVAAAVVGLALAYFDRSVLLAHLTMFGCLLLYGFRKLEGAVNSMSSATEHFAVKMVFTAEIVDRALSLMPKTPPLPPIFAGDAVARDTRPPSVCSKP